MRPFLSRHPLSLRGKIILPYLVLALALAIGASLIGTRVVFDSIQERFVNQLIEAGKLASEWMVKEESRLLETQRYLAHADGIPEALQSQDAEKLRSLAYPIAVNNGEEAVEFLDRSGTSLLSMHHRPNGNVEDYEFSRGEDTFKQLDFVQATLQAKSDVTGDKYAGVADTRWGRYLYISSPVFSADGQLVGVALVGKSVSTLARQMREATLAEITLYGSDGQAEATTFLEPPALTASQATSLLAQKDSQSFKRDLVSSDISYTEVVGAWQVRHGTVLGLLGASFAKNFLVLVGQSTWAQILVAVLIALILTILIGYAVANRISRPIADLERAAALVASGDLRVQVKASGDDEIAQLTGRFNDMVTHLDISKRDLDAAYDTTLEGWVKALDLRDRETSGHSQRVVDLTVRLAHVMTVDEKEMEHIRRGALLHDIGKIGIPDEVLLKPGPLSDAEWAIMRQHPVLAAQMLKNISFLKQAVDIPACHHERWDGSGYPDGLKGQEIPQSARIFAVVDTWDSMLSDRPYRRARPEDEARAAVRDGAGTQFDPVVVAAFLDMVDKPQDKENSK